MKNTTENQKEINWSASGNYVRHDIGDIIKHDGQWVQITSAKSIYFDEDDEDAYVFGCGPGETVHYSAVLAPPEVQEAKDNQQRERKEVIWSILDLINLFQTTGTHPMREPIQGEIYLVQETAHCYNKLSWFDIAEDGIWYCQYNGGDGHCWAESNIRHGYMAIGKRLDYSPELESRIQKADQYIKSNNISLYSAINQERVHYYQKKDNQKRHDLIN